MTSSYGTLAGRGIVETAAVQTLQEWIVTYLAETERTLGLTAESIPVPPDLSFGNSTSSIHGGVDFDEFQEGNSPEIIVTCKPDGNATRFDAGGYRQDYELIVGAMVVADDEDITRALADQYGMAIMQCLVQQGTLGGVASWTRLVLSPEVILPNPDVRRLALCQVTFRTCVFPIVEEAPGPGTPIDYDPPPTTPTVQSTDLTITAEPEGS